MPVRPFMELAPIIVGLVLIGAAATKMIAPFSFHEHVLRLGILPAGAVRWVIPLAIGLEAGWGALLLFRVGLPQLLAVSVCMLGLLTAVSWWGVASGRAADCGCYGGLIRPSIRQSAAMNGFYVLLLAAYWTTSPSAAPASRWTAFVIASAVIIFACVGEYALRSELSTGMRLFRRSPLRVGRAWRDSWGDTTASVESREKLISYLGPECPHCREWVRVLNVIHATPTLPNVTAIISGTPSALAEFVSEIEIRFPISTIPAHRMQRLVHAVPTTVLIEDGIMRDMWSGYMSADFLRRFKLAFFPAARASPHL